MFMIYLHEQNRHLSYLYGVIWSCDIRRNMHLIFGQLHWIAVKTLVSVISWVVLLLGEWGDLWTIPKSRNRLPEKKITKLEGRNLLSQPPELWKGEMEWREMNHQLFQSLCPYNEDSMKTQKDRFRDCPGKTEGFFSVLCGMWDLTSLTRDWIRCSRRADS